MAQVILRRPIKVPTQAENQAHSTTALGGSIQLSPASQRRNVILQPAKVIPGTVQAQAVTQTQNSVQDQVSSQDQAAVRLPTSGTIRALGGAQQRTNLRSQEKRMMMKVEYGDINLIKQHESGGDDVSLQTFKMRVRVNGNGVGMAGNKYKLNTPGEAIYNTPSAIPIKAGVRLEDRIINFNATDDDYLLRLFDPQDFWSKDPSLKYLKADVAVGGAIAWQGDSSTVATGIEKRRILTDGFLRLADSVSNNVVKSLQLPFNYKSFVTLFGSRNPASEWVQQLGQSLGKAVDSITGNAAIDLRGSLSQLLWDRIISVNGWEKVVGVHMFVLIPTTAKFYNELNKIKESSNSNSPLRKLFPYGDLLGNVSFYSNLNLKKTPALDITYGFIPASDLRTEKIESIPFRRPIGEPDSLTWKGGWPVSHDYGTVHWANQMPAVEAQLI